MALFYKPSTYGFLSRVTGIKRVWADDVPEDKTEYRANNPRTLHSPRGNQLTTVILKARSKFSVINNLNANNEPILHIHTHVHHKHTYTHTHTHTLTQTHTHTHTQTHTHTHTLIQTYTLTQTHTHTLTQTQAHVKNLI